MTFEQRAQDKGYKIEAAVQIEGRPLKAIRTGNLVYTSGQLSLSNEKEIKGKVGKDIDIKQAQKAAQYAGLNCLSAIKKEIGSLDNIVRIIKVFGMVNVDPDFNDKKENNTSAVIDGCSNLLYEIFGESGQHTRTAVGMTIPRNYAVEVEMIVEVM